MALKDITQRAVLDAIAEFDRNGPEAFLDKYGFGKAKSHFVVFGGREYDAKAIAGAAHGYLFPGEPLGGRHYKSGHNSVQPLLQSLGFTVRVGPSA